MMLNMYNYFSGFVLCLNKNQGAVLSVLTFVYVVATIRILASNKKQNMITLQAIEFSNRPYVFADLYNNKGDVYLLVKNYGSIPAVDVEIDSALLIDWDEKGYKVIPDKKIPLIASSGEMWYFLGRLSRISDALIKDIASCGEVKYLSLSGVLYKERINFNVDLINGAVSKI